MMTPRRRDYLISCLQLLLVVFAGYLLLIAAVASVLYLIQLIT